MKRDWSPAPAGEVEDGLILFDGVCVLCSTWVDFVIKRDPAAKFRFLPIQTPRGRATARHFSIDQNAPETNVVVKNGNAHFKFDTILAVVEELPGWRWLTILRHLPRAFAIGSTIASPRIATRFSANAPICRVPTADEMRHIAIGNES